MTKAQIQITLTIDIAAEDALVSSINDCVVVAPSDFLEKLMTTGNPPPDFVDASRHRKPSLSCKWYRVVNAEFPDGVLVLKWTKV